MYFFEIAGGAALRQDVRRAVPNVLSTSISKDFTDGVQERTVTMDLVMVHCTEEFDIVEGGNGVSQGFSSVVWDAGLGNSFLRFRRRFIPS